MDEKNQINEKKEPKSIHSLSIIALALGLISFFVWKIAILVPFAGIIVGILAITRFDKNLNTGKWAGYAGLILSILCVLWFFFNL